MIATHDGITLVGTAHILASSVREVEETIRRLRPRKVLVELDPARLKALQDPEAWQQTDIVKVIRERKQHLFLLQLYLAAMQAQMGRETGVQPGTELLRAVQVADEVGAEVVLIDRDVAITLRRGFGSMGLWARMRLFWKVWMELLTPVDPASPPPDIETVLKSDAITEMTEQFAKFAPQVKVALIDERDDYMASHIREEAAKLGAPLATAGAVANASSAIPPATAPDAPPSPTPQPVTPQFPPSLAPAPQSPSSLSPTPPTATPHAPAAPSPHPAGERPGGIVAVVGAGHLKGILARLAEPASIPPREALLQRPPRRFPWGIAISLTVTLLIVGWLLMQVSEGDWEAVRRAAILWAAMHIGLAGLGAALAFGHPWAVATGALAAPLTSIVPVVKSGWLAGFVQAKVRTPKVRDFQSIKHVESFGGFWRNGVVRVITVTTMTGLGAMVARYTCLYLIGTGAA